MRCGVDVAQTPEADEVGFIAGVTCCVTGHHLASRKSDFPNAEVAHLPLEQRPAGGTVPSALPDKILGAYDIARYPVRALALPDDVAV